MTPESETSMNYFQDMARSFDRNDMGFTARFKAAQAGAFGDDVEILEASPDLKLHTYNIDQGGVRARQIVTRLIRDTATMREAAE